MNHNEDYRQWIEFATGCALLYAKEYSTADELDDVYKVIRKLVCPQQVKYRFWKCEPSGITDEKEIYTFFNTNRMQLVQCVSEIAADQFSEHVLVDCSGTVNELLSVVTIGVPKSTTQNVDQNTFTRGIKNTDGAFHLCKFTLYEDPSDKNLSIRSKIADMKQPVFTTY